MYEEDWEYEDFEREQWLNEWQTFIDMMKGIEDLEHLDQLTLIDVPL